MTTEAFEYMKQKVDQYNNLKTSKWWLEHSKDHLKEFRLTLAGNDLTVRCSKELISHLNDGIYSLLAQEIQEVERQMGDL